MPGTLTTLHLETTQKTLDHRNKKEISEDLLTTFRNNPTKFWKLMSPKTTPRTINLNDHNGGPVGERDCPEVLNDYLSSVFTNKAPHTVEPFIFFK